MSWVAKFLNAPNSRQRLERWPTGGRSDQAQSIGADAVVMIRYTTSMIVSGASEILANGVPLPWHAPRSSLVRPSAPRTPGA
ncbi:MAG: heavy metal-binding domain-containing protein [Chloroflexi bacterium]|nr:heavy metal-binding domain-containing protein [Chloroflexota bacterium]